MEDIQKLCDLLRIYDVPLCHSTLRSQLTFLKRVHRNHMPALRRTDRSALGLEELQEIERQEPEVGLY